MNDEAELVGGALRAGKVFVGEGHSGMAGRGGVCVWGGEGGRHPYRPTPRVLQTLLSQSSHPKQSFLAPSPSLPHPIYPHTISRSPLHPCLRRSSTGRTVATSGTHPTTASSAQTGLCSRIDRHTQHCSRYGR